MFHHKHSIDLQDLTFSQIKSYIQVGYQFLNPHSCDTPAVAILNVKLPNRSEIHVSQLLVVYFW